MRNIAASMTEAQILDESKDVTRRMGWLNLKKGDRLQVCRKCMGRKPGEALVKLKVIEVVSVRRETIGAMLDSTGYGREECRREGFPDFTPTGFVEFWIKGHPKDLQKRPTTRETLVTRIEFKYVANVDKTGTEAKKA